MSTIRTAKFHMLDIITSKKKKKEKKKHSYCPQDTEHGAAQQAEQ